MGIKRASFVLYAAALGVSGCVAGQAVEGSGLAFSTTGCFLDESGSPTMVCPNGSIEVVFGEGPALELGGPVVDDLAAETGLPGCTLDCLLEECPDCPALTPVDEAMGASALAASPVARAIYRDAMGLELETVPLDRAPRTAAAQDLLATAGLAAEEYASDLDEQPMLITSSHGAYDPMGGYAAALLVRACPGVTASGTVHVGEDGKPSVDGTLAPDTGSAESLPVQEQRKVGFIAYLMDLVVSAQCQDPGSPMALATIQAGPMPGGAALAALMTSASLILPRAQYLLTGWTQRINMNVMYNVVLSARSHIGRLGGDFQLLRNVQASGVVQAQVDPGRARVVIDDLRYIRHLTEGGELQRISAQVGPDAWRRLASQIEGERVLWAIYRNTGGHYNEVEIYFRSSIIGGPDSFIGRVVRLANGMVRISSPNSGIYTTHETNLASWPF